MTIYGPRCYPPGLQLAINHAERFTQLMNRLEATKPPEDPLGRAWLTGRADEVETVLASFVADWHAGRLSAAAAETAANSYLQTLHAGAQRRLGPISLYCCGDDNLTTPTIAIDALTLLVPVITPRPRPLGDAGETLCDPRGLLELDLGDLSLHGPQSLGRQGSSLARSVRLGGRSDADNLPPEEIDKA